MDADTWQVQRYFEIVEGLASGEPLSAIGKRQGITGSRVRQIGQKACRYYRQSQSGDLTMDGSWQSRVAMSLIQTKSISIRRWLDENASSD